MEKEIFMFKQSSQSLKFINRLLTVAAIAILFAAAASNVSAQYKGLKLITKTVSTDTNVIANEAVDIDQCANGAVGATPIRCQNTAWENGNLNENKSHYVEGDSIPYRDVFTGLAANTTYTITLGYDTTKSGKHAIDFLTAYNRTETNADPCSDKISCATFDTAPIPQDPTVPDAFENGANTPPRVFTIWGATIDDATGVTTPILCDGSFAGDSTTCITVTFTTASTGFTGTVVLAWGGHIATRANWGIDQSAVAISGSPYHMRNESFSAGNIGQQDRSLSASAVFFPAVVTIIKEVTTFDQTNASTDSFGFTAVNFNGVTSFSLVDNNVSGPDTNSQNFLTAPAGTITVTENANSNWSLNDIVCSISSGGGLTTGTAVGTVGTRTATITLQEANIATCTFKNGQNFTTAANASIRGRVMTQAGYGIRGALVTVFDASTGTSKVAITNSFGYYTFTELPVDDLYILNVSAKRYTFSNGQQSFVMNGDLTDINFTSDQ
jgi:hypothetical protein